MTPRPLARVVYVGLALSLAIACVSPSKRSYVPLEGVALGSSRFSDGGGNLTEADETTMSLGRPPSRVRGGSTWTAAVALPEKAVAAQLQFAADGNTISQFVDLDLESSNTTWSFDHIDTSTSRFRLIAIDEAGRMSFVLSPAFAIDSTAPVLQFFTLSGGPVTNAASLSLVFAACGDTESLLIRTEEAPPDGTEPPWLWQTCYSSRGEPPLALIAAPDGEKSFRVWARDDVGNVSDTAEVFSVIRDTTPPTVTLAAALNGGYVGAGGSLDWSSSDEHLEASSATLELSSDAGVTFTTVATGLATSASFDPKNLPEDAYVARVSTRDIAGNVGTAMSASPFVYDRTAPSPPVATRTSASPTNDPDATLQVSDCAASTALLVNEGGQPGAGDGGWLACAPSVVAHHPLVGDGTHALFIWGKDAAGNVSTTATSASAFLDTTLPSVTLTNLLGGEWLKGGAAQAVTWTATDTGAAPLAISLAYTPNDGASWAPIAGPLGNSGSYGWVTPGVEAATYRVRVTATDAAGNSAEATSPATFAIDSTPPSATSVLVNDGDVYTGTVLARVATTFTDNLASTVAVRIKEANVAGDCVYANDAFFPPDTLMQTHSLVLSALDGTKKVCAWARDPAGNTSVIVPPSGSTGNTDSIVFENGNIPVVTAFSAVNTMAPNIGTATYAAGDTVAISWTMTDVEGLDSNPATLSYTTDNATWTPILTTYGNLGGNPTSYGVSGYTGFVAPSTGYFRFKLVARDKAGNTSVAAFSDSQNTGPWSVYAGSTDHGLGGTGRAAYLGTATSASPYAQHLFAIDPLTNDIFAFDAPIGLYRLDASSGLVTMFAGHGAANLPDDGALPATPTLNAACENHIRFDSKGSLYVTVFPGTGCDQGANTAKIYQIDLTQIPPHVRAYVGGGAANDGAATASTVFVSPHSPFAFDADDTLYFLTSCSPGQFDAMSTYRLMKVTQNPDGSPGAVSVVAGNCVRGDPPSPGPSDALSVPFTSGYAKYGDLAVFESGGVHAIYYALYTSGGVFKILDGQSYPTNITATLNATGMQALNGKLYVGNGEIREYTPNLLGPTGETYVVYATANGALGCTSDGKDATSEACVNVENGFTVGANGTLFFSDGPSLFSHRPYRVRFKDGNGKLQTVFGSLPFYGDGLGKPLIRGNLGGIHYKHAGDPNQAAFPAGLYFMDSSGPVFGYVDESPGRVANILWGSQQGNTIVHPTGTQVSAGLSLGNANVGANGSAMAFGPSGLPFFRYSDVVASIAADNTIVAHQTGVAGTWDTAPSGADAHLYHLYPWGAIQNLTVKGLGVFLMGGYRFLPDYPNDVSLMYFDFATSNGVLRVMGDQPDGSSPDNSTPGAVQNLALSGTCINSGPCYTVYREDEDRLYFSEDSKLRYITTATTPATSTLGSLPLAPSGQIESFAFTLDHTVVYYVRAGHLYCHRLSGVTVTGETCDDATSLGPPAGMTTIARGPNQLTWEDSTHLLISNYAGEIYRYTTP